MKKYIISLLAITISAFGQEDKNYIGASANGALFQKVQADIPYADKISHDSTQPKSILSPGGSVVVGHFFGISKSPWSVGLENEASFNYMRLNTSVMSQNPFVNGRVMDTDIGSFSDSLRGNVGYRIGDFRPYIGTGLGYNYLETYLLNSTQKVSTWIPEGQVFGGVDYYLSPDWALTLEYKYKTTMPVKFDSGKATEVDLGRMKSHQVQVGFKFLF